jgi:hypothetical protein
VTSPRADLPEVHDAPPLPSTGIPAERDPLTGKLLPGGPLGREDKGRTSGRGKGPLVAAGAALVAAVTIGVLLVPGGDDEAPAAAPTTTEPAAPTTSAAPVELPPRVVPMRQTIAEIEGDPVPGAQVGDTIEFSWTLTGPCDGTGPCTVEWCAEPGADCGEPFTATPGPTGYVHTRTTGDDPPCEAAVLTWTYEFTVSGDPAAPVVTGRIGQSLSTALEFLGSDGSTTCLYSLVHVQLASV